MASVPEERGLAPRELALRVLERVERDRAWADAVLGHEMERANLGVRERALAAALVYGCLAWRGYLDWQIDALCRGRSTRLKPAVRQVLRLGLFQLLFLDRIPDYAAVSTTVELAGKRIPWARGLVNALLRRAVREGPRAEIPVAHGDPASHLSVRYSHPKWLVSLWLAESRSLGLSGTEELASLLAANNRPAPTVLRVPVGEREGWIAKLCGAGVGARGGRYSPQAVVLEGRLDLPFIKRVCGEGIVIQAEASQLVAYALAPARASSILDACAGPGGKATHIAELAAKNGRVVALDARKGAGRRVAELASRLGTSNLHTVIGDARRAAELFARSSFDRVLVDAPCSGLGTLRTHPELRWRRTPEAIAGLARLQRDILDGVANVVRPDGILLYATCTLVRAENEDVVRAFLETHPEFRLEDPRADLPEPARLLVGADGVFRTFPHRHDLEGFFAVRLRRRAERP